MDFADIKSITISHLNFQDLVARRTNNPLAEAEIPTMLREAIEHGVEVIITDSTGDASCKLVLNGENLEYEPRR
jgi:hypothetical protein